MQLLESDEELRRATARAVKRHDHVPAVELPRPLLPATPVADALAARRSARDLRGAPPTRADLSALLHAGYGVTGRGGAEAGAVPLRAVPSGGALYPLELYVVARCDAAVPAGLYHYDPLRHVLEQLELGPLPGLLPAMVFPNLVAQASHVVVVTAMFWRTRFKYGQRGFRFALLEAGHVAQNLLLACAALELAAVPLGGFFDRRLDELLELDGVDESALYVVAVGGRQ